MGMKELIEGLKTQFTSSLSKDSSAEDIKAVEDNKKKLDEIEQEFNKVVKEKEEVTQLYIESQKNQGSKELPNDDNPKEPRSLEEIAKAIVEQDKK